MPIPKPERGESQDAYMKRCMHFMAHDDPTKRPHEQQVAICLSTYGRAKKAQRVTEKKEKA